MSYRMIFILLFTSFIICEESITQVTEIFPNGRPKEITIYKIDDNSSDYSLIPSTRYIYNPNGELHKYQEWWINGKKSKEVLIQRDQIIERNWSNKGFPEDTHKFNIDDYSIPPINSTTSGSKTTLSSLLSDIEKTKYDLNNLSSIVEELIYEMNLFKKNELHDTINSINDLAEITNNNISSLESRLLEIEENLINFKEKFNNEAESDNYANWKKNTNTKIDDMRHDIRIIKNEIKYIKKEID